MAAVFASSDDLATQLVALRREIHRRPELGFEEENTARIIERELDALGLAHRRVAKTGVVAVIHGAKPGHTVGLRADMDALPIGEESGEGCASEVAGKMHACGHDAHVAMLLGAARELLAGRDTLSGNAVLLFQPAEEGPGGALPMIEAGVMDDEPKIEAVAMLHVDVRIETGSISVTPGPVNASADEIYLTVRGAGGHGASPHKATDTIPCAAAIVLGLQNIAARETDPLGSVVVTIGTIEGGYRNNVIADVVKMSGTLRAHDPGVRAALPGRVRRIVENIAAAYACRAEVHLIAGYPPVINAPVLTANFAAYARETLGLVVHQLPPTMGAEDFAYFAQRKPGVLVRLGIRNEALGSVHYGHSPQFKLDEGALPTGVRTLVGFARGVGEGSVPIGP
ncbi:MAG: M20 family metallopeptidase [Candidatus Velthaea sp.]|jgi:amidohydrolase